MAKSTSDDGSLPPERAKAQARREAEFLKLLGVVTDKTSLDKEIAALVRIIASDRDGLQVKTLNASDRSLLQVQIGIRDLRLEALRQRRNELAS